MASPPSNLSSRSATADITALTAFPRNCLSRHQLLLERGDEEDIFVFVDSIAPIANIALTHQPAFGPQLANQRQFNTKGPFINDVITGGGGGSKFGYNKGRNSDI